MCFQKILIGGIIFCISLLSINTQAIPAFARKTNIACSTCHSAWPMLNSFGRQYKEHGYRVGHLEAPNKTISSALKWDEELPVSVVMVARPYDKKDSGEFKNRALHEVELMIAGPMGEKMSGFFELEAEDEVVNDIGYATGIAFASLSYNHNEAVNLQFSWGSALGFDPYNSYSASRRMTRGTSSAIDNTFGGADNGGKIKSARQNISLYGRPISNLFYGLSLSGGAGDSEGEEGENLAFRLAYDMNPMISIGVMHMSGTGNATSSDESLGIVGGVPAVIPASSTPERDFTRTAFDVQAFIKGFNLNVVQVMANDDNSSATRDVDNSAFYGQLLYTVKDGMRTTWAPLVRYDNYDKKGGDETIAELTLGVNYYFTENVRGMLEYWDRTGDGTTKDDNRLTVQLYAAF